MSRIVKQFACLCGAQSEGLGDPPACWSCGGQSYQWATRSADFAPMALCGERADARTENGDY